MPAFTQLRHSALLLLLTLIGLTIIWLVPPWAAVSGVAQLRGYLPAAQDPMMQQWQTWAGMLACVLAAVSYQPTLRRYRCNPLWCLALPAIALFYMAATLASACQSTGSARAPPGKPGPIGPEGARSNCAWGRCAMSLDELRMQMLGVQVMFGFQFDSLFQDNFAVVGVTGRRLDGLGLACMVIAMGLMIGVTSQHRMIDKGMSTMRIHGVAMQHASLALMFLALGLGAISSLP